MRIEQCGKHHTWLRDMAIDAMSWLRCRNAGPPQIYELDGIRGHTIANVENALYSSEMFTICGWNVAYRLFSSFFFVYGLWWW